MRNSPLPTCPEELVIKTTKSEALFSLLKKQPLSRAQLVAITGWKLGALGGWLHTQRTSGNPAGYKWVRERKPVKGERRTYQLVRDPDYVRPEKKSKGE